MGQAGQESTLCRSSGTWLQGSRLWSLWMLLLLLCGWQWVACDPALGQQEPVVEAPGRPEPSVEVTAKPEPPAPEPATAPDDAAPDVLPPEPQPEPVKEEPPPDLGTPLPEGPLAIKEWFVATLSQSATSDPIRTLLERNTFVTPAFGGRFYGLNWFRKSPDQDGKIGQITGAYAYAAVNIKATGQTRVIVRADRVYSIFLNGARLPGDVYGNVNARIPITLKGGDNHLVMQLRSGEPKILLEVTRKDLYLHSADHTLPEYVVGQDNSLAQCAGVPLLNMTQAPIRDITAMVKANEFFEETKVSHPGIPAAAVTQLAFLLKAKKTFVTEEEEIKLLLSVSSPDLAQPEEREITMKVSAAGGGYRLTRLSEMDRSCQFMGILPPSNFDPKKKYALYLSLHGAGVNARGQARSYSQKDWAYVIAPTNRRPFGFDWEVFGQRDGLEALRYAKKIFNYDPTKVYVGGHSMGGHGTWQFAVLFPGLFATASPSAGWSSFYSYTGRRKPTGVFARSQASSETNNYISNVAKRGVYIIHGDADNNVPVREGRDMFKLVQTVTQDAKYHEQPGAGHWWNVKDTPGTDCVDLPDMMDFVKGRTLDPNELDFSFVTPGPWISATHSYVTIRSMTTPQKNASVKSEKQDKKVLLTTDNVRSMVLDGAVLQAAGISAVVVDGKELPVSAGPMTVGPQDGKKPGVHGPFNETLYSPFCLVYDQKGPSYNRDYVAFLASNWALIGNGQVCSVTLSQLTADIKKAYNIVYVGLTPEQVTGAKLPFSWSKSEITVSQSTYKDAAMFMTYPVDGKLANFIYATQNAGYLLYRIQPFTSSLSLPDYIVLGTSGAQTAGFFDATWKFDQTLRDGN